MDKKYQNQEWLYNEYVTKNRSSREIGNDLHISYKLVEIWLNEFKIPVRKPVI